MSSLRSLLLLLAASAIARGQTILPPRTPQPVIQDVRLVFSMVSHPMTIPDRINFYNVSGNPKGAANYSVPHLVCDPLVTLYNPYDTALSVSGLSIRLWDPPVGFRFRKNDVWLRPEYEAGQYLGLARLQIANQASTTARKSFTFALTEPLPNGNPGAPVELAPGESRTFSPWVEPGWTWGAETAGGFQARCFFDWDAADDFTNRDGRTGNARGVEMPGLPAVHGYWSWATNAGYQWDYLASNQRSAATRYPFENATYGGSGWVAIRNSDTVAVEATVRPLAYPSTEPDFRVSILAYPGTSATRLHQDLRFRADAVQGGQEIISRIAVVADLLQSLPDRSPGGKSPFALFSISARREALLGGDLQQAAILDGDALYDVRFQPISSFSAVREAGDDHLRIPPAAGLTTPAARVGPDGKFHLLATSPAGIGSARLMAGPDPGSLTTDLTDAATMVPLPAVGATLERISVDRTGLGTSHFFQLRKAPAGGSGSTSGD